MDDRSNGFKEQLHWKLDQLKSQIREAQAEIQKMTDLMTQKQIQVEHVLKLLEAEGELIDRTELDGIIPVSLAEVAARVLRDHGNPMHYKELAAAIEEKGHRIPGQNPDATVIALLHRRKEVFSRLGEGMWGLKGWNTPAEHSTPSRRKKAKRHSKRRSS